MSYREGLVQSLLADSEQATAQDIALHEAYEHDRDLTELISGWTDEESSSARPDYEGSHGRNSEDESEAFGPVSSERFGYEDGAGI
jgi:hypothetical protein